MTRLLSLSLALLLAGCCRNDHGPKRDDTPVATPPGGPARTNGNAPTSTTAEAVSPQKAAEQARKALQAWVNAQNTRQVDAYLAHYDPATFRGVLRTSDGAEKKLDFAAWKEQRSRMITNGVTVAAESPRTVTWAENPGLGQGVVEVRFLQRWKNAKYGDHGPKVMHFRVNQAGARIIYEELVSSTPGWSGDDQCGGDSADSELPCPLPGNRVGWCKGGVCKDICPAGFSYHPNDTRCHQRRDCPPPSESDPPGGTRSAQCQSCVDGMCMDASSSRDMKP